MEISNDLMIQWGHTSHQSASGFITITFTTAFTTAVCYVDSMLDDEGTDNSTYVSVRDVSVTGFKSRAKTSNTTPKKPFYWLAFGY